MAIASGLGRAMAKPIGRRAHGSAERLRAVAFARAVEPVLDALRAGGLVGNGEIAAELDRRGVPAEAGAGWTPQRVAGLRRRLEALNGQPPALHHRPVPRRFRRKLPASHPGAEATAVHTETAYGTPNH